MLHLLRLDLIVALRSIRKHLATTGLIVLTLALGIGVNTAAFSVVQGILLRPLPYKNPSQLMMIWRAPAGRSSVMTGFRDENVLQRQLATPRMFRAWRERHTTLEDVAAIEFLNGPLSEVDLNVGDRTHRLSASLASPNLFRTLGVTPSLGQAEQVVENGIYISDRLWRNIFGGDRGIVGKTFEISMGRPRMQQPVVIAGVLPDRFQFTYPRSIDVWAVVPWTQMEQRTQDALAYTVVGRLKHDISAESARAELQTIVDALTPASTARATATSVWLEPIHDYSVGRTRDAIWLLSSITIAVMVVAALSAAVLVLARTVDRGKEFATLTALGAGRSAIIRKGLAEALVYALSAGLLAVLMAAVLAPLWQHVLPSWTPRVDEIRIDLSTVLVATASVSAIVVILGMIPCLFRPHLLQLAGLGGSTTGNPRSRKMTTYLIATEVTFVMLLLVCGSWFVRSFWELTKVDLGFRGQQVIAADLRLLGTAYLSPAQLIQYRNQLLPKLSAVPGVQSVAFASPAPFVGDDSMVQVRLMDGRSVVIGRRRVDPEYFDVLSMALIQGRRFEPSDSTRPVTVITETLAEQLLLGSNAIGKTLAVGNASLEIIGVVGAVRTRRVSETPLPAYYIPWTSQPSASFTVLVRTAPGQNLTAAISDTIANIDRHQPLHAIGSLQDLVADSFGDRRLYAQATIGLALATMILAGAGICGVLIQSISQRRRELGIRLAVGAAPRQLLRAVVAESLKPVVAGAIVGAVASYQTFGAVKHLLFSVDAIDATSFGLAGTCLLVAAVVATWSVGKHLARVDIASALKE